MSELAQALAACQAEFPAIPRNKIATVRHKSGGSHTYRYADLEDVLQAVRPVLTKHGFAVTQQLRAFAEQRHELRTVLLHKQGGTLESTVELPGPGGSPQEFGSTLTYLRRYALVALLGIATEDDTDAQPTAAPAGRPKPSREPNPPPAGVRHGLSPGQRDWITREARQRQLTKPTMHAILAGFDATSLDDLEGRHTGDVIAEIKKAGQTEGEQ